MIATLVRVLLDGTPNGVELVRTADYGIISPSPILLVLTDAQDAAGKTLRTNDVSEDM